MIDEAKTKAITCPRKVEYVDEPFYQHFISLRIDLGVDK